VTIDSIQKAVAERFQIKQSQLKEKSNTKKVVYPRQVAMYLVKELTDASLPESAGRSGASTTPRLSTPIRGLARKLQPNILILNIKYRATPLKRLTIADITKLPQNANYVLYSIVMSRETETLPTSRARLAGVYWE